MICTGFVLEPICLGPINLNVIYLEPGDSGSNRFCLKDGPDELRDVQRIDG